MWGCLDKVALPAVAFPTAGVSEPGDPSGAAERSLFNVVIMIILG
jgi:hypothetical protein